jgi:hypothetical protein
MRFPSQQLEIISVTSTVIWIVCDSENLFFSTYKNSLFPADYDYEWTQEYELNTHVDKGSFV